MKVPQFTNIKHEMMKTNSSNRFRFHLWKLVSISLTAASLLSLAFTLHTCMEESKAIENPSIAVLPASSSMCDPELEYISAGMHDAIIAELGNVNSLLVKSKNATKDYLDSKLSGQQIGTELGANLLVRDEVICTEKGMRYLIRLIQVLPEEKELWSKTYDLDLGNSLNIYKDITKQIVKYVKAPITSQEKTYLSASRPVNSELYKKYLQGIFYINKLTPEGFAQGLKYLNEAVDLDPNDPLPYLGLALAYSNTSHASDLTADGPRMSYEYALKALSLDSTLAEAYTVLATKYLYGDWDFPATEKALEKSIALNPNIASLRYTLGWYSLLKGDIKNAEEEMKRAVEIEPLDPFCIGYQAWFYLFIGRYDESVQASLKALELDPNYPMALYTLGSSYAEKGMFDEAIKAHKKGLTFASYFKYGLGIAYARAGMKKEAYEIAIEIEKENSPWDIVGLSELYAVLGDNDKAIQYVQAMYDNHDQFIPWLQQDLYLSTLQDDPRFKKFVSKINLPV